MSSLAFAFDGKNEAAQEAVDAYIRNYNWSVSTSTREAINDIVTRSIREGIPPRDAAQLIKQSIGLDPRRAGALATFHERLLADGRSLAAVNKSTSRYATKLMRARSLTIARTETMAAMNAGALQGYKQARGAGLLEDDAGKEWMVTPDDALCAICAPMAEEAVPLDETFSNGLEGPPAHPQWRCALAPATAEEVAASTLRNPAKQAIGRDALPAAKPTPILGTSPESAAEAVRKQLNLPADVNFQFNATSLQTEEFGYFNPHTKTVFLNDVSTVRLNRYLAGKVDADSFLGVNTLVHESTHAQSSFATAMVANQRAPFLGAFWEEAVVETLARRRTSKMLFGSKPPPWVASASESYAKNVASLSILEANGLQVESFLTASLPERAKLVHRALSKATTDLLKKKGFTSAEIAKVVGTGEDLQSLLQYRVFDSGKWSAMTRASILDDIDLILNLKLPNITAPVLPAAKVTEKARAFVGRLPNARAVVRAVDEASMGAKITSKGKVSMMDLAKITPSEGVFAPVEDIVQAYLSGKNVPPIVVNQKGVILDGHHRWASAKEAARRAGWKPRMHVIVVRETGA